MKISSLKKFYCLFDFHFLIWKNPRCEFKYTKIDNKMYKKYSLYIGHHIYEIGKTKYGTNRKSLSTTIK